MTERRSPTPTGVRVIIAVIGIASVAVAIGAAIAQVWLSAVGSALTAVAMGILSWNARTHRVG